MFKSNTLVLKGEQQNYLLASSTANCQAYKLLNRALPLNQSSSFLLPLFLYPIPLFSPLLLTDIFHVVRVSRHGNTCRQVQGIFVGHSPACTGHLTWLPAGM